MTQIVHMYTLHGGTPRDLESPPGNSPPPSPVPRSPSPTRSASSKSHLEAQDKEQALQRVWDAVAASGTDDHIVFFEHPDLPEHWRRLSGGPAT